MPKKRFALAEIIVDEKPDKQLQAQTFPQNFQTALLLSLLEKTLITQWQFDRCVEELRKQDSKS